MREPVGRRVASGVVWALLLVLLVPAVARADLAPWSVAVNTVYGDPIGEGSVAFYDDGNAWMTSSGNASAIGVTVGSTWRFANYSLHFEAPAGETLAVGRYDAAASWAIAEPQDPKLD